MTTLEQLKGLAVKSEELRVSGPRKGAVQCVLVIPLESKEETKAMLGSTTKTGWPASIDSQRYGQLSLTVLDLENVTRVGINRKKTYKAMIRKLSEPHPEDVSAAQRQLAKAEKGVLPGIPRSVLEERLLAAEKDVLSRRVRLSISRLEGETQRLALEALERSDSVLITNWFEAPQNLWLSICTERGSKNQRAKNGVTLLFSAGVI
ncbi:MAG: hypothetical protein NTX25_00225 [Proteobacteria bacterium]|nr:hypothetical protein [Pseudomonadota bacterium]